MGKLKKINTKKAPKGVIGNTGALLGGGLPYDEPLSALQFPSCVDVYRKMYYQDPVVAGFVNNIIGIFTGLRHELLLADPHKTTPAQKVAKDTLEKVLGVSWHRVKNEFGSAFIYGFSIGENVYRVESSNQVHLTDIEPRSQASIEKIDDGYVWQYHVNFDEDPPDPIPETKCLMWQVGSYCRNPYGVGLLKHAYKSWYFKSVIQAVEAQSVDRDLAGLPVITSPPGFDFSAADKSAPNYDPYVAVTLTYMSNLGKNIRKGTQACAVMPDGWDIDLLRASGKSSLDINKIIARYNNEVAVGMLSAFLGNAFSTSNQSNVDVSSSYLLGAIDSYALSFADAVQEQVINRLCVYNNIDLDDAPRFRFRKSKKADLKDIAGYVARLASQGALRPTEELEEDLLDTAGLPVGSEYLETGEE